MPFAQFHSRCPGVAGRETRTITVLGDSNFGLPAGQYGLLEMYCDEPGCDCRRVFFYVVSSLRNEVEAVIAYGWESPAFYARWLRNDDPTTIEKLRGPAFNLGSPQSRLAPAILNVVKNVVLRDTAFVERLKAHYRLFRDKIDKGHTATASKTERKARKSRA